MDISSENPVNQVTSLLMKELGGDDKKEHESEPSETPEETLESDENPEEQAELSSDENTSVEEEGESPELIETLNSLAEELDIPIEDMYALSVKVAKSEAFPEGGQVSLGELKDFYTNNVGIETEREALKQKEIEIQTQSEQMSQVPRISNELLQARAQVLAVQDAYNRTDWQGIRHTNPAEYAALQNDFRTQFDAAKQSESVANEQLKAHIEGNMKLQQERLFEIMPELKEGQVAQDTAKQVQAFASKYGITAKEIDDVTDHRIMRMLIDASRSETAKVKAKSKQAEKKAPVTTKPSARKPQPGQKAILARLTEKAKKTNSRRDQVNAVAALLSQ